MDVLHMGFELVTYKEYLAAWCRTHPYGFEQSHQSLGIEIVFLTLDNPSTVVPLSCCRVQLSGFMGVNLGG